MRHRPYMKRKREGREGGREGGRGRENIRVDVFT